MQKARSDLNQYSYIGVPVDIGPKTIPSSHLSKPLITTLPSNKEEEESEVITKIADLLKTRKDPVIVVDGGMFSPLFDAIQG